MQIIVPCIICFATAFCHGSADVFTFFGCKGNTFLTIMKRFVGKMKKKQKIVSVLLIMLTKW